MAKNNGFTLIELLLVVALMAIAVGVTSDVLVTLVRSYNKSHVLNEIEQNTNFIAQKMEKELRNAVSITELDPADTTPLERNDAYKAITFVNRSGDTITYQVDNNVLSRDGGDGNNLQPLTTTTVPGGVIVTCVETDACFKLIETNPQVVQINISLRQAGTSPDVVFEGDIKLENIIVIRDTY